jgi:heme oxygenase
VPLPQQDLAHFLGPDWSSLIVPSHAAQAYTDHLQQLADDDPVLLLPYAFSLYIPILLGFMAQRIQKNLQLPAEKSGDIPGLAFFTVSSMVLATPI